MRQLAENILTGAGYYQGWTRSRSDPPALIELLADYASSRPGLDPRDYGYDPSDGGRYSSADWRQCYMQDSRRYTAQYQDVKTALRECYLVDVTDQDIIDAAPRAFSGRLEIEKTDKGYKLSYCAGQYAPTEYRAAIAAVLFAAARVAKVRA